MSEKEETIKVSANLPKSLVKFIDDEADGFTPKLNRQQMIEYIITKYKADSKVK